MSKAIWQYVILIGLFPFWWGLFFFFTLLISILNFIVNFEWSFMKYAKEFGLGLDPIKMFIELESDSRNGIKQEWKK